MNNVHPIFQPILATFGPGAAAFAHAKTADEAIYALVQRPARQLRSYVVTISAKDMAPEDQLVRDFSTADAIKRALDAAFPDPEAYVEGLRVVATLVSDTKVMEALEAA